MNNITIAGRIGQDPKFTSYGDGKNMCRISVGVTVREKNRESKQWENTTQWYSVALFGRDADTVQRFCSKGSNVIITGQLRAGIWNSNNGPKVDLSIEDARFHLGPKAQAAPAGGGYQQQPGSPGEGVSDDLPF